MSVSSSSFTAPLASVSSGPSVAASASSTGAARQGEARERAPESRVDSKAGVSSDRSGGSVSSAGRSDGKAVRARSAQVAPALKQGAADAADKRAARAQAEALRDPPEGETAVESLLEQFVRRESVQLHRVDLRSVKLSLDNGEWELALEVLEAAVAKRPEAFSLQSQRLLTVARNAMPAD